MSTVPAVNVRVDSKMVDSLLQVNNMLYKMPPSISIAESRHLQSGFAQQSTYSPGETIVIDSQTGAGFIDGNTSYIRFNVIATGNDFKTAFGVGSAVNVFERAVIRSRSGQELCRLEGAPLAALFMDRFSKPADWFTSVGESQGYPGVQNNSTNITWASPGVQFVVPMKTFPFFKQSSLLPPQVMEGLRIELVVNSAANALTNNAGTTTGFTLANIEVKWDVYNIADQFRRQVALMASSQGLNLLHKELYRTITTGATSSFNYDVKKAASKALMAITIPRLTGQFVIGDDAYSADTYHLISSQYHVGSVYFPNSKLQTPASANITAKNVTESYYWSVLNSGVLRGAGHPAVTLATYVSDYGASIVSLNKSQTSDMAGTILNNSRALQIELEFDNSAATRRLDTYLQHLRAIKVFSSNVIVRD